MVLVSTWHSLPTMLPSRRQLPLHFSENHVGSWVFPAQHCCLALGSLCTSVCSGTFSCTHWITFICFVFKPRTINIHIYIIHFLSLVSYSSTKPQLCLSPLDSSVSWGTRLYSVFSPTVHQRYELTTPHKYKGLKHAYGTTLFPNVYWFSPKAYLPGVSMSGCSCCSKAAAVFLCFHRAPSYPWICSSRLPMRVPRRNSTDKNAASKQSFFRLSLWVPLKGRGNH